MLWLESFSFLIACRFFFTFLDWIEVYTTDAVCCNGEHIAIKNILNQMLLRSLVLHSTLSLCLPMTRKLQSWHFLTWQQPRKAAVHRSWKKWYGTNLPQKEVQLSKTWNHLLNVWCTGPNKRMQCIDGRTLRGLWACESVISNFWNEKKSLQRVVISQNI